MQGEYTVVVWVVTYFNFSIILEACKLTKIGSTPTLAVVGTAIPSVQAKVVGENGSGGEDQEMARSYGVPGVVLDVRAQDPHKPGNFLLLPSLPPSMFFKHG